VTQTVLVDFEACVATVTVDHPPVNALSNDTIDALFDVAQGIAADDSICAVVLTGRGEKAFMAGADLTEFSNALGDAEWIEDHTARVRRMLDAWERLPQPVIAAAQASALGGGLEMLLVCDLVVADPAARFGLPEVRLGLMPGAGGTQRLPRRIGIGPAKAMLLLGETIDADEALRLGLVNRVSPEGQAVEQARAIALRLAQLSAVSVRAIKAAVSAGADLRLEDGLDGERESFMRVFASDDAREGVDAFVQNRRPTFQHR
jgi:enoyl-CoA hydratase/carnithine racemase